MSRWSTLRALTTQLFLFDFVQCFTVNAFIGCRTGLKPTNANFDAARFAESIVVLNDGFYGVVDFLD